MSKKLLLCFLLLITSCSLNSLRKGNGPIYRERTCLKDPMLLRTSEEKSLWVVNLGWHTGLALETKDLEPALLQALPEAQTATYAEFGWGDKDFYTGENDSYFSALGALFFSGGSVLHLALFSSTPQEFFSQSEVTRLFISHDAMKRLQQNILDSLETDKDGEGIAIQDSLYGAGHFYKAKGRFSLFHTCNSWASDALSHLDCHLEPGRLRASSISKDLENLPQQ